MTGAPRATHGFTLIELAVVLMIVGLMVGGALYGIEAYRSQSQQMTTHTHLRRVEAAITTYVAYRGRLPRPAAIEDTAAEGTLDGTSNDATLGFLPWETLGLSRLEAHDGWNRHLRYAVFNLQAEDDEPLRCNGFNKEDGLFLQNADGEPDTDENVSYVVWSVGADGVDQTDQTGTSARTFAQEGSGGLYDDLVAGRSAAQVLIDSGCRVQTEYGETEPEGGEPGRQGPPGGMISFNDRSLKRYWGGAYEGFNTTETNLNNGHRTYEPTVEDNTMKFGDAPDWTKWQNGSFRSCVWPTYHLRLEDSDIRMYMEVAFKTDPGDVFGHGMVATLLPWEMATRTAYFGTTNRCGEEGPYLGFASKSESSNWALTPASDFADSTPSANSDIKQRAAFGAELDIERTSGTVNGRRFYDPDGPDHAAIILHNTWHDEDGQHGPANPDCDSGDASCLLPQDGSNDEEHWLEQGLSAWAAVRVEVLDGPTEACPLADYDDDGTADAPVEVRTMIWPADVACAADCTDVSNAYASLLAKAGTTDSDMRVASRCLAKPTRRVEMGQGWEVSTWSMLKPGFTVSLPMDETVRSDIWVRDFVASSGTGWETRPAAAATAVSVDFRPTLIDEESEFDWSILEDAGAPKDGSGIWTGTSWLSFPNLGVDVTGWRGELTLAFRENEQPVGWGLKGIGGSDIDWWPPPLIDNVANALDRPEEGQREEILFTFDQTYHQARVAFTEFTGNERAIVKLYQASDPDGPVRMATIEACDQRKSDVYLTLTPDTAGFQFDTIAIQPDPQPNKTPSSFHVWRVRGCGASAGAACTQEAPSSRYYWPGSCSVTATATAPPPTPDPP